MLPTLWGRLQSRVLILGIIGGLWTVIIAPLLPDGADLGQSYALAFVVLAVVIALGIGWELIYHVLQQFRWEKDWPTMFGLFTGINEGILAWLVLHYGMPEQFQPSGPVFALQFVTTWLLVWVVQNGPLRAIFPHWRFRGGRFF